MTILWYGEACFLLESGGTRILIEPPERDSGLTPPRLKSDILIFSRPTPLSGGANESETFIIESPGEYEIKNVNITGVLDGDNIMYGIDIEGINLAYMGFLKKEPDNEKMELLGKVDIILVPVGGLKDELLDAETAMKLINKLEPSIAIPMLFDIKGLKIKRAPLSEFIKESEAKDQAMPKLAIKKKDINEEETKIVILEKI